MATRLVLLATTPRVAPGLLAWPAWQALRSAVRVLVRDPAHPQTPPLREAGIPVEVLDVPPAAPAGAPDRALAGALVAAAAGGDVVYLVGPDGDPGLGAGLAELAAAAVGVEVLSASWDLPGARLLDLVAVMDRLRSPGGCPWDAEQTHESLVQYLVEETYETIEAIESGDLVGLREELGDLLLQVVFHARVGEEHPADPWSIDDVAGGVADKLVRRHPHVFTAPDAAATASEVEASWEQLKAAEKQRTSATDGVPFAQPALSLAAKLMSRAEKAGVGPAVPLPGELDADAADGVGIGELLLAVVALARARGVDPEAELRAAARRYAARVRDLEGHPAPPAPEQSPG